MQNAKFSICQYVRIKSYKIEGTVQGIFINSRNINIQYDIEYLDKNNVIQNIWLNECELEEIVREKAVKNEDN